MYNMYKFLFLFLFMFIVLYFCIKKGINMKCKFCLRNGIHFHNIQYGINHGPKINNKFINPMCNICKRNEDKVHYHLF